MVRIRNYQEKDKKAVASFVVRLREETYGSPPKDISDLSGIKSGYHLFLIDAEGIILSFGVGEDCDEDDVILFPPIDTDLLNCSCLKINGVDELW